ncbi:MAG: FAD-dependent oxidoreductase, partial [Planctomycetaceae bacterium]
MLAAEESGGRRRLAVVGAGITGLSAALRLIQQHEEIHVDVFEAAATAGGAIRTEHRDGFLIEHGPDAFITNKPGGLQLCNDLGITDRLIGTDEQHRRSLVVHRGRLFPVPDGFMLMAPAKPMAILKTRVLSLSGKLRLLSEAFR